MPHHSAVSPDRPVQPGRTLWLLSIAHAVNHAQGVLLPLVYLRVIVEFGVGADTIALLAAAGAFCTGIVQLGFAKLTRVVSRRKLLAAGGLLFGGGFAAQAAAPSFAAFAAINVVSRVGGSPQHPVATPSWPSSSRSTAAASRSAPTSRAATWGPSSSPSSAPG